MPHTSATKKTFKTAFTVTKSVKDDKTGEIPGDIGSTKR